MTSFVHLVRHGRPAAGWGEDEDPGLDDVGHAQARDVAKRLLALPVELRPTRVATSPLRRCRETAAPFAEALGLQPEIDTRVGEIPTPAGLSAAQRPDWLRAAMAGRWSDIRGDIDYAAWRELVVSAVRERLGQAVFSHFVAINAVCSLVQGKDEVLAFRPDHVSVTTLELREGALHLVQSGSEAATRVL